MGNSLSRENKNQIETDKLFSLKQITLPCDKK